MNVNTAGPEELQRLEGIGPELAGRIVEERRRGGPFADLDQLVRRVRGIGRVTAAGFENDAIFSLPDSSARGNAP